MEDKIIELADYFISENTTYREAKIACEKLLKQVSHEIELRALESKTKESYEQTTRLSGYVRTNSATDGGQAGNFFAILQQ